MPTDPRPSCRQVNVVLADYLDGELPFADQERVERHLVGCVACLVYLAGYRETLRLVRMSGTAMPDAAGAVLADELVRTILASRPAVA